MRRHTLGHSCKQSVRSTPCPVSLPTQYSVICPHNTPSVCPAFTMVCFLKLVRYRACGSCRRMCQQNGMIVWACACVSVCLCVCVCKANNVNYVNCLLWDVHVQGHVHSAVHPFLRAARVFLTGSSQQGKNMSALLSMYLS